MPYIPKLEIDFINQAEELLNEIQEAFDSKLKLPVSIIRKLSRFGYDSYWKGYDDAILANADNRRH